MRNTFRVGVFDLAAPIAAIAALVFIGIALAWPLWWVAACSVLCLLILQGMAVNFFLARRDSVTVGTDDDGPGLRLAVVVLATAALVAAVLVGYTRWTVPDRNFTSDSDAVVRMASSVSEATATFSPQDPTSSIDRVAAMMAPAQADVFKAEFTKTAADLSKKNVSAQASTVSAGIEALGPDAASVAVVMHGTQNVPGQPPSNAVLALRVTLKKDGGHWQVFDVTPINPA
ncbi:MAG: putative conserved transrane protein [Mycobacterium sp.]|nr:putative conserved transrane protein [Mycobacterium sp.]